jgi:hypothetical protein
MGKRYKTWFAEKKRRRKNRWGSQRIEQGSTATVVG